MIISKLHKATLVVSFFVLLYIAKWKWVVLSLKSTANYQMIQNYKSKSWEYMVLTQDDRASIVFTDEKDYSHEIAKNRQNDRVYGPS